MHEEVPAFLATLRKMFQAAKIIRERPGELKNRRAHQNSKSDGRTTKTTQSQELTNSKSTKFKIFVHKSTSNKLSS